jgi:hypothetical protein
MATKKVKDNKKNFPLLSLLMLYPKSGMEKNLDLGSGMNISDPQN